MECSPSTGLYYPRHEEYVGGDRNWWGLCARCGEVVDAARHAAGKAQVARGDREEQARRDQAEADCAAQYARAHPWE